MIDVKREDVQKELDAIDVLYAAGIQKINDMAKADRAAHRKKTAEQKRYLKRLIAVLPLQPEVNDD